MFNSMFIFNIWEIWFINKILSDWAVKYCGNKEDTLEVRKYITESVDASLYCRNINDDPEIRKYITQQKDASAYCAYVRNDIKRIKRLAKE